MAGEAILIEEPIKRHKWKDHPSDKFIMECEECGEILDCLNEYEECLNYDPYIGEEYS